MEKENNESKISKEEISAISLSISAALSRKSELMETGMSEEDAAIQTLGEIDNEEFHKWKHGIQVNFSRAILSSKGRNISEN